MNKSGTKNYVALSQSVEELEKNDSISAILSDSKSLVDKLKLYREKLLQDDTAVVDKDLEVHLDYYQSQTLKHEKSLNKSLKSLSAKVDKSIDWELDQIYQYQTINDDFELLVRAIVMDLLYEGNFEEAKIISPQSKDFNILLDHFKLLRVMMKAVYDEDYTIVFNWIMENENFVDKLSDIKVKMIKLIYFQVLEIKQNIATGAKIPLKGNLILETQNNDDQTIMLKIRDYYNGLSRYSENTYFMHDLPQFGSFDKEKVKDKVATELIGLYNKISSKTNNLQKESPINRCLLAGHFALGTMLKYNRISRRKSSSTTLRRSTSISGNQSSAARIRGFQENIVDSEDYSNKNKGVAVFDFDANEKISELPLEIELPKWMGYHSIFICPILKEETTNLNRPHVLPCRHFISDQALSKLAKGLSDEFKCPYCPRRGSWREASGVKFIAL